MTLIAGIDPGASAGVVLLHAPSTGWRMPSVRAQGWAVRGDRPRDVADAVERLRDLGCTEAWVERQIRRHHEKASDKSLITLSERCGYWVQALGVAGILVERVEPHVWQRATGARELSVRYVLARELTGIACENDDVATAACLALYGERVGMESEARSHSPRRRWP